MNKLKVLIIVVVLIVLANMTFMVFFSEDKGMVSESFKLIEKKRDFTNSVSIQLMIKGGLFSEDKSNNGIGTLFANSWVKSNKILESAEFYGGSISASVSPFALEVNLSIPSEYVDEVYDDFDNFLTNPVFSEEIFNREKGSQIDEIKASEDNPNTIAKNSFMSYIYEGTPYAMPVIGHIPNIEKLKLEDIKEYYDDNIKSGRMTAVIVGNYSDNLTERLRSTLSKIDKGRAFKYDCDSKMEVGEKRVEETDKRIKQAKLYIGYESPDATSSDYASLKVLNDILGGGMSSRYFTEIRKNSSYAYAVGSAYPSMICASRFFIFMGLDYKNVDEAVKKVEDINKNLSKTITEEEIDKAKKSIVGSALMETQSNRGTAWVMAFFETVGLGANYYERYVETLKHVDKKSLDKVSEIFNKPKFVYVLKPAE